MFIFQELPPTRYDLRFSIFGFPVRVHPLFWIIALLFGSTLELIMIPVWVLALFLSILIHELGHALAFRRYGQDSRIVLHFGGGLTIPEPTYWGGGYGRSLTANQQIFISFAGPGMGFLFSALLIGLVFALGGFVQTFRVLGIPLPVEPLLPFGGRILNEFVRLLLWISVFWGLINLAPVFPLDGGNIARNIFLQADPIAGVRKSLWLSVIAGGLLAVIGLFLWQSMYIALLFGFLAFQSYQSLQSRF